MAPPSRAASATSMSGQGLHAPEQFESFERLYAQIEQDARLEALAAETEYSAAIDAIKIQRRILKDKHEASLQNDLAKSRADYDALLQALEQERIERLKEKFEAKAKERERQTEKRKSNLYLEHPHAHLLMKSPIPHYERDGPATASPAPSSATPKKSSATPSPAILNGADGADEATDNEASSRRSIVPTYEQTSSTDKRKASEFLAPENSKRARQEAQRAREPQATVPQPAHGASHKEADPSRSHTPKLDQPRVQKDASRPQAQDTREEIGDSQAQGPSETNTRGNSISLVRDREHETPARRSAVARESFNAGPGTREADLAEIIVASQSPTPSDDGERKARTPKPRSKGGRDRTMTFAEVYCKGKPEYYHTIIQFPANSGKWYIMKCDEHGVHFGEHPLAGAAKHLVGSQHMVPDKRHDSAVAHLGIRITDCTAELAEKNNSMVRAHFAKGNKPFNLNMVGKKEKLAMGLSVPTPGPGGKTQKSPPTAGDPSTTPSSNKEFKGLVDPKPEQLYLGYWSDSQRWYPIIVLPWRDLRARMLPETSNSFNKILLQPQLILQAPACYIVDKPRQIIVSWAPGYEDGGRHVRKRKFPVVFQDASNSVAWLAAEHITPFSESNPLANMKKRNLVSTQDWFAQRFGYESLEQKLIKESREKKSSRSSSADPESLSETSGVSRAPKQAAATRTTTHSQPVGKLRQQTTELVGELPNRMDLDETAGASAMPPVQANSADAVPPTKQPSSTATSTTRNHSVPGLTVSTQTSAPPTVRKATEQPDSQGNQPQMPIPITFAKGNRGLGLNDILGENISPLRAAAAARRDSDGISRSLSPALQGGHTEIPHRAASEAAATQPDDGQRPRQPPAAVAAPVASAPPGGSLRPPNMDSPGANGNKLSVPTLGLHGLLPPKPPALMADMLPAGLPDLRRQYPSGKGQPTTGSISSLPSKPVAATAHGSSSSLPPKPVAATAHGSRGAVNKGNAVEEIPPPPQQRQQQQEQLTQNATNVRRDNLDGRETVRSQPAPEGQGASRTPVFLPDPHDRSYAATVAAAAVTAAAAMAAVAATPVPAAGAALAAAPHAGSALATAPPAVTHSVAEPFPPSDIAASAPAAASTASAAAAALPSSESLAGAQDAARGRDASSMAKNVANAMGREVTAGDGMTPGKADAARNGVTTSGTFDQAAVNSRRTTTSAMTDGAATSTSSTAEGFPGSKPTTNRTSTSSPSPAPSMVKREFIVAEKEETYEISHYSLKTHDEPQSKERFAASGADGYIRLLVQPERGFAESARGSAIAFLVNPLQLVDVLLVFEEGGQARAKLTSNTADGCVQLLRFPNQEALGRAGKVQGRKFCAWLGRKNAKINIRRLNERDLKPEENFGPASTWA